MIFVRRAREIREPFDEQKKIKYNIIKYIRTEAGSDKDDRLKNYSLVPKVYRHDHACL